MSITYEEFKKRFTKKLQDRLGSGYEFNFARVPKNNGIVLDGLSVRKKGSEAAPMVYLERYYDRFQEGEAFDLLTEELADICRQSLPFMQDELSALNDFSKGKDKVVYSLIQTSTNKELLKDVPSVPYLDLSIVFFIYIEEKDHSSQARALIHNCHLDKWGTTVDELYSLAQHNTPRLLPLDLMTLKPVFKDTAADALLPEHKKASMYVLSNVVGLYGAAALLYPGALKAVADKIGKDLVILPSRIHEVILIPYDEETVPEEIDRMVYSVNRERVPLEDRLSDHAYLYSRDTDMVVYLSDAKPAQARKEKKNDNKRFR